MTRTEESEPQPVLGYEMPGAIAAEAGDTSDADLPLGQRRWRIGTLSYTFGGLVTLFFWLLGGDFTWQLRDRAIAPTMPLLLRKFGGSDFITGLLLGTLPAALGI